MDVGCGTGIHMNLLQKRGKCVEGIDLNDEMLDIAKNELMHFCIKVIYLIINLIKI